MHFGEMRRCQRGESSYADLQRGAFDLPDYRRSARLLAARGYVGDVESYCWR